MPNLKSKGFTLVELLVVMTIIAILAGLGLVSYQGARKSARDGKRKADLEQIRSALEMYRADNGTYPADLSGTFLTYITLPTDPLSGRLYPYTFVSGAYTLCAALETVSTAETGCGSCGTGYTCSYKVTNP